MKRISRIKQQLITHSLAAMVLGAAAFTASAESEVVGQTTSGVPYVSGGVGAESLDQLGTLARQFNLKLVFALKSGDYVSDVKVSIADLKGKTFLDSTSEGPWFYTKLPAGNYQVVATFAGKPIKRQVTVDSAKLSTVDFRWASE